MYKFDILFDIIDELNKVFYSPNPFDINFDYVKQKKANKLLHDYCEEIKLHDTFKKNEEERIKSGLTIIDKKTNQKEELVDIESMFKRVDEALLTDEYSSCITALNIANRCAHGLDDEIQRNSDYFTQSYNYFTGSNIEHVSFMKPFKETCPKIPKVNKKYLDIVRRIIITEDKETEEKKYISNKDFISLVNLLKTPNMHINRIKRYLKKDFKIDFKDDEEAQRIFEDLQANKDKLIKAYIFERYRIGKTMVALKDEMFVIKNNFISIIGQMLSKNKFGNIKYELVHTPSGKKGHEYMLIIDKPDLSYYVEVHMPDYLKREFTKIYGFKVKPRTTIPLGASAVYKRVRSEAETIKNALKKGLIEPNSQKNFSATSRAAIISRGIDAAGDRVNELERFEKFKSENKYFQFRAKKILPKSISRITGFLKNHSIHKYDDTLRFSENLIHNESYSIDVTYNIACNYHYNIYQSLESNEKELFVYESLYYDYKDNDYLDNCIMNTLIEEKENYNINNDIIAKIIIYKEILKSNYKEMLKNNNEYTIERYIDDLIENYSKNNEMENDHEKPKYRR